MKETFDTNQNYNGIETPTNYPRSVGPSLGDVLEVARAHRFFLAVAGIFFVQLTLAYMTRNFGYFDACLVVVAAFPLTVVSLGIAAYRLAKAIGLPTSDAIFLAVVMGVPLFGWRRIAKLSTRATCYLKEHGVTPGSFGTSDQAVLNSTEL